MVSRKGHNYPILEGPKKTVILETPSRAESPTLRSNIRGLVRDEDEREFESDPCSCLLLVKNVQSRVSASVLALSPCLEALHCPASSISDNNWEESRRLGLSTRWGEGTRTA